VSCASEAWFGVHVTPFGVPVACSGVHVAKLGVVAPLGYANCATHDAKIGVTGVAAGFEGARIGVSGANGGSKVAKRGTPCAKEAILGAWDANRRVVWRESGAGAGVECAKVGVRTAALPRPWRLAGARDARARLFRVRGGSTGVAELRRRVSADALVVRLIGHDAAHRAREGDDRELAGEGLHLAEIDAPAALSGPPVPAPASRCRSRGWPG